MEEAMWKQISRALAIAIVIASISAIPLANAKLSALRLRQPHDYLSLTHHEKRLAWRDLHKQAIHQYGVPWFAAIDRWILPPKITTKPVSRRADRDVPALRGYNFAIVKGALLIVNPTDHAVAAVVRSGRHIA
jgi:hypothetical protein